MRERARERDRDRRERERDRDRERENARQTSKVAGTSAKAVVAPPSIILTKEREKGESLTCNARFCFGLLLQSSVRWLPVLMA